MTFDPDEFHQEAIQIPSHENITAMRDFLVETLVREGYSPDVDERGNVLATRGTVPEHGFHLVLNTHLDTVPPHVPLEVDGDLVRGRGACDAKGPLAALLDAFFSATLDDGRLTLAVTPDEETAQFGSAHLATTLDADGYIVGEPTGLDVCPAARGSFGGFVKITGESAHASDPEQGVNPIRAIGSLVEALEQYDDRCGPGEHAFLGKATLTPSRVEAGGPLNQIPAACTVSFDRRMVPPETVDEFVVDLRSYLDLWLPDSYDVEVGLAYPESPVPEAFATDRSAELVQTLTDASGGSVRPFHAASDASHFAANGPTVVFGPGVLADEDGPIAHSDREYISRTAIVDAADTIRTTIEALL